MKSIKIKGGKRKWQHLLLVLTCFLMLVGCIGIIASFRDDEPRFFFWGLFLLVIGAILFYCSIKFSNEEKTIEVPEVHEVKVDTLYYTISKDNSDTTYIIKYVK